MAPCGYRVLTKAEEATVKEVDKDCKNKFKFQWLEEEVHVKLGALNYKVKIGDSIVKINVSGKASCEWCHSLLTYKGKGLSTLKEHLKTDSHVAQLKTRQSNYGLGSFVQSASQANKNIFPIFKTFSKPQTVVPTQEQQPSPPAKGKPVPVVPLADRVASMEAMILAVMAENAIPLTLAPVIVDLAKACSNDPQALSGLKLSASSAAYKIRFGLAKTTTDILAADLQKTPFSLNIDEATSSNTKKVLSILGYVRLKEPNSAATALESLQKMEGGVVLHETTVHIRVVEGDEELQYWQKMFRDIAERRAMKKEGFLKHRAGQNRRGGRGGGRGGGRFGYVRLKEPNSAATALESLQKMEGGVVLHETTVHIRVVEGDEELQYWQKMFRDIAERRAMKKEGFLKHRAGHNRRGGRGGGRGGGRFHLRPKCQRQTIDRCSFYHILAFHEAWKE
ncbi:hypothetical protein ElyMa_004006600 [Elysia marginata]|uniref:XRRM domain-containing protein n=1 Tax=Elysia marginata TaxID=1093978 RepID=A0AAV4G188_9GAST|nr:hypothetical protein ElyMa_004006600 [Elysia marginata]